MRTRWKFLVGILTLAALAAAPAVAQQQQHAEVRIHQPGGTQLVVISAQNGRVMHTAIARNGGAVTLGRNVGDPPWNLGGRS